MERVRINLNGVIVSDYSGHGAWSYIISKEGAPNQESSGTVPKTTVHQMQLTALISALKECKEPSEIQVLTRSHYIAKGLNYDLILWLKRSWLSAEGKTIANRSMWIEVMRLMSPHSMVKCQVVKKDSKHKDYKRSYELTQLRLMEKGWISNPDKTVRRKQYKDAQWTKKKAKNRMLLKR